MYNRGAVKNSNAWSILADEINTSLQAIYTYLSKAFAEGKEKPEGEVAHRLNIFTEIWKSIDERALKATSLTALDAIYHPIEDNINNYIRTYYRDFKITNEIFPESKKNFLVDAIKIHYALYRQRFLLLQFRSSDNPDEIARQVEAAKTKMSNISHKFNISHFKKIEKEINAFYGITINILNALIRIKYTSPDQLKIMIEGQVQFDTSLLKEVNDEVSTQLKRLPVSDDLVKIYEALQAIANPSKKKNQTNQSKALVREDLLPVNPQEELTKVIELIAEVQDTLKEIISSHFHKLNEALESLTRQYNGIDKKNYLSLETKPLLTFFNHVLRINGYKDSAKEVKGFTELRDLAYSIAASARRVANPTLKKNEGFLSNLPSLPFLGWKENEVKDDVWIESTTQTEKILMDLANKIEIFIKPYLSLYYEVRALQEKITSTEECLTKFDLKQSEIAAQLSKGEHVWSQSDAVFTNVQVLLLGHLEAQPESHTQYIKSFLQRHWGKISVGGTGGGGFTTLLCFLLSVNPWTIALLGTLGVFVGGSSAALTGAGMDQLSKKKEEHSQGERKPLLDKQQDEKLQQSHPIKKELLASTLKNEEDETKAIIPPSLVYQPSKQSNIWSRFMYGTFWTTNHKSDTPSDTSNLQNTKRYS